MRYAILADIHANLAAFNAVLEDIRGRGGADKIWCLGDIVGYGPQPHECIELLRRIKHVCIAGNHDWGATGKLPTRGFNPDAVAACKWTAKHLSASDIDFLENLPLTAEDNGFTLVHGSPREPIREYVIAMSVARENFNCFRTRYCLVGHTHKPAVFVLDERDNFSSGDFSPHVKLALGESRLIINPGSVGQPRDRNPDASYAIYDTDNQLIRLYRVPYDVRATQDKMVECGLPIRLVARLGGGI